MRRKKYNIDRNFKGLLYVLSFQLAVEFVGMVVFGCFLGHLFDLYIGKNAFTLVLGGVLGIIIGGINAFYFIRPFWNKK